MKENEFDPLKDGRLGEETREDNLNTAYPAEEPVGYTANHDGHPHDPYAGDNHGGRGGKGWMILSLLLAAALVIVLIKPPFAKDSGEDAVGSVNDTKITKDQLYKMLSSKNGEAAVNSLITEELVKQEAAKKSIQVTDAEINKEIDFIKKSFQSEEEFNSKLEEAKMTLDELKDQTRTQLQLTKLLGDKAAVSEDEIKSELAQVQASHILVGSKEEADAILKEIKAGADFAKLAKEKSGDEGTKDKGGDLGFFTHGMMDPAFEKAAFSLKKGEVSEPVQSSYGFHIIKVTDRKEASKEELADRQDEIRKNLTNQKVSQEYPALLDDLKAKAKITNTFEKKTADKETEQPADTK